MKQNTMAHGKGCLPAEPDSWMILHVIGHLVVRRSERKSLRNIWPVVQGYGRRKVVVVSGRFRGGGHDSP